MDIFNSNIQEVKPYFDYIEKKLKILTVKHTNIKNYTRRIEKNAVSMNVCLQNFTQKIFLHRKYLFR